MNNNRIFYGWWILLAAIIGLAVSPAPIAFYSIGVLMQPLSEAYGWSRSDISLAATLLTAATVLTTPAIGILVDRIGPKKVLIPSMLGFALSLFALSFAASLSTFHIMYFVMGVLCAGANSMAYMRLLSYWFDRRRGLVVGIATAGMGLGFSIVPGFTQYLVDQGGTGAAYTGLGLLVLCAGVPVVSLIVRDTPEQCGLAVDGGEASDAPASDSPVTGISSAQAIRLPQFWIITGLLTLGTGTIYSLALHLVSIVRIIEPESGMPILAASIIGVMMVIGRLLAGYAYDRIYAPWVTGSIFISAAAGTLLLATGLPGFWIIIASVLIGLASGAESDALAILVGRYFGLLAYGKIYGHIFCASLIGITVFPYILGLGYDHFGNYTEVLYICAALFGLSVILSFSLGPHPEKFD